MKPYRAVKFILETIEKNIELELNIDYFARETGISQIHLQRIFKMAFGIPLARYIKLRKLSASVKKLAFLNYRVIDVANEFGFEHEQSYIRAFKREFNITPGQFRNSSAILKTTPPFNADDFIQTSSGLLALPDIVVIPEIYLIGMENYISYEESFEKAPRVAREFWENHRLRVKNVVNKNVYIGLTRFEKMIDTSVYYLSGMQVSNIKQIPNGLTAERLPPSEYLRFVYIGEHHYYDINSDVANGMFNAIEQYIKHNTKYIIEKMMFFERIDTSKYDGTYCYMEWFTPVSEKS